MAVSKPLPGQRIDRTAPLAQYLAAFWPLNEGGGSRFNDAAGNVPGSGVGTAHTANGVTFNGSAYISTPAGKLYVKKTTKFSAVIRCSFTTSGVNALLTNWNNAAGGWEFVTIGGGVGFYISSSNATNYIGNATNAAFNDGKLHTFGFDYDGSVTAAGIKLFVEGVLVAQTRSTVGTGDPGTLPDYGVLIAARNDSAINPVAGTGAFCGMWIGGNLGAAGHAALAQNPWQLWPDEPQLVFAPASGVTGTSSATLTTTGTATGAVAVAAASSQTLPLTGTSTGAVAVAGASAGTIPLTGSAAGAVAVAGASSQAVSLAGTATGAAAVAGASSGTVDLTGTATGTIPPLAVSGDSAVTVDLAGTATGAVAVAGASSGTITTTGTAAATNPVAGASSATLAFTGSAAGAVDVAGASAVTISTTGSATGEVQNFAAVSDGTFTLAGTATGSVEVAGASAQQIELGGAAAFTIRNILGSSAGRVQTSASRTEALNSADRQNTFNPARIAAGSGKRGSNVQTGKR